MKNTAVAKVEVKGVDTLKEMIYWNAVAGCFPDSCGCSEICPWFCSSVRNYSDEKQDVDKPSRCVVIAGYLESVFQMMVRSFPKEITEDIAFRIGMHLIPLYKVLCRLKMQEYTERETMFTTLAGAKVVNPIFQEIRKTISEIERVWKNLGFLAEERKKKTVNPNLGYMHGESYYEIIEKGGLKMRGKNE